MELPAESRSTHDARSEGRTPRTSETGSSPRSRRGRRRVRRLAGGLIVFGAVLGGGLLWLTGASPLLDPTELFPAGGTLTIVEGPIDAFEELDRVIEAAIAELPTILEFRGRPVDLPPGALSALAGSGPWRVALWQKSDGDHWALFLGGEAYGPARRRWLGGVAERVAQGEWRERVIEVEGAIVIASDREWLAEVCERVPRTPTRPIRRGGLHLSHADSLSGSSVDLWFEPQPSEAAADPVCIVTEVWRGEAATIPWRERLTRYGVEIRALEFSRDEVAQDGDEERTRLWEARGVQSALHEFWLELRRFR